MIQPYKMSSLLGNLGYRGVEKPSFLSQGLEEGV